MDALLLDAREGRGGALLLAGDAGIGKTALLHHGEREAAAAGMFVLAARGMQSESDIPFAGLSELLAPLLDALDTIPRAQAALRGTLALTGADGLPDRFAVSAAVLSLLAGAAETRPVLVAVDDVQWLDASSLEALLFARRRLRAEGIALLGTMRSGYAVEAPWLERLEVGPLPPDDARALLSASVGERVAASVTERLPQDDRIPPRRDLPQARRARPRAAGPPDGDGAARGRARPGGARRRARVATLPSGGCAAAG